MARVRCEGVGMRAHGTREARECARVMREGAGMKRSMANCKGDSDVNSVPWAWGDDARMIWTWRARRGWDARIWCEARESARAQGMRKRVIVACVVWWMLKGLNILSTSSPAYEQGAGSAHVRTREAYGRVNIGRVCARERGKTARICARSKGWNERGWRALGGACNWQNEFLHNALQFEGAPMGGAVRGVEAPYKLIGCARCARLGVISREFDYIGRTREERPFLCKCVSEKCI
ncbi:hypothetical protein C8R48DRAFT_676147 [Suillus tomentosus]|nr:hypothetical protein C8R48DRAFT_676147 [Suillus tomentosus]